ncbi:hypothetical protein GCM10023322_61830 [Rugosimonospora acidiphila]|uniref:DUF4129 domain-containing protein n=1 Tax=Rugosimonospora acidiphila TaxID=556531 RepID=A0ABP9SFC4_9ACTN
MSFLEDVFRYEEDEPGSHRQRPGRYRYRWLVRPVLLSVAGAIGGGLLLRLAGLAVPYPLIFMVLLTLQLLRRVLAWIEPGRVPESLLRRPPPPVDHLSGEDGLRVVTDRWETLLSWVRLQRDPVQFVRMMQPRLVQLVDERLRLRHGVSRQSDPTRARELLGESLWTFMTTPVSQNPSARELAALISQMEAI